MITSEKNAQLKELQKIQKNAKYRRQQQCFLVEGRKLVQEAATYGRLSRVLIRQSLWEEAWQGRPEQELGGEFSGARQEAPVSVEIVENRIFDRVSDTVTPQGILGIAQTPTYSLEQILQRPQKLLLLLDGVRDPGNLGTILRTAEAAGVSGVILSRDSVDLMNPKVVRATMGSIFRVPFWYAPSLPEVMQVLRQENISVYGTVLEMSRSYDEMNYTKPTAIVIGNEANGISAPVRACLEGRIHIPMAGQVESLNAAVAAAVVLYEAARQRRGSGIKDACGSE